MEINNWVSEKLIFHSSEALTEFPGSKAESDLELTFQWNLFTHRALCSFFFLEFPLLPSKSPFGFLLVCVIHFPQENSSLEPGDRSDSV